MTRNAPLTASLVEGAIRQRAEQLLSVHVVQTTEALGHPLRIDIVDSERKGGLGLDSIRERAVELRGQCQFETLPDGGTLISAKLPIKS